MQPHRQQPTRLPCPWDSPGKNTGVGCHFLLQCMKVKSESEVDQPCLTLRDPMDCSPPGSSAHGIFQPRVLEWGAITFSDFFFFPLGLVKCFFLGRCQCAHPHFLWDECVEKTVNSVKINNGKLIVPSQHQEAYWAFLAESDNTAANRKQKRSSPCLATAQPVRD